MNYKQYRLQDVLSKYKDWCKDRNGVYHSIREQLLWQSIIAAERQGYKIIFNSKQGVLYINFI